MNWIARKSSQFLITCFVLIGISALPSLVGQLEFVPSNYWGGLQQQVGLLTKLDEITYYNVTAQRELPLLPAIGPLMKETVIIFMTSLVVAVGFALLYAYSFYRSGRRVRTVMQQTSQTLEMVPDLFWLIFTQFLAITLYKKTGFDRIEVAGGFAEYIRFLPIVTLSLTILFFFLKWLTNHILQEETTPFLELARAKGVRPAALFWKHLLPNLVYRFYLFFRSNLITVLSSLLIIEYLFNVQGIFRFIVYNPSMPILLVILFVIYIPIFLVDVLAEWLIPDAWKGGV
ncbi:MULTISPECIES: ABC transporter permease subunit [Exiguobacterium]|uniref:ABC transporter permease subunit n=1 Tax=Exiguobacterium TaxID=33986 RepID=UPI001BEB91C5|nr:MULTISPECIES: ABC transporter permease subunit [Exiguobacterium]MCT4782252.1 ABC transporter permease subunit [Exiguobacterium himgiriensis]